MSFELPSVFLLTVFISPLPLISRLGRNTAGGRDRAQAVTLRQCWCDFDIEMTDVRTTDAAVQA